MSNKSSLSWIVYIFGIVIFITVIGFSWMSYTNINPSVVIPTRKMPAHNAFDVYVSAVNGMKDTKKINAIAKAQMDKTPVPLGQKVALVEENKAVLLKLRQGFNLEYASPPFRSLNSANPSLSKFGTVARLMVLDGEIKESRGDWSGAMDSYIDTAYFGHHIATGSLNEALLGDGATVYFRYHIATGSPIEALLGDGAIGTSGRSHAWKIIDRMNAQQCRNAARRLERMAEHPVRLADVLREEKWVFQATLMEILSAPNWRQQFHGLTTGSSSMPLSMWLSSKRSIMSNYTNYMDECIKRSQMPYGTKGSEEPAMPNDLICTLFAPSYYQTRLSCLSNGELEYSILAASLALRAYRLEHGKYPVKLDELAPLYLSRVPRDPFAVKGPLKYKPAGNGYILYSIGPDAKDDTGTPIDDTSLSSSSEYPNTRYLVWSNSIGDIVAGVNTDR